MNCSWSKQYMCSRQCCSQANAHALDRRAYGKTAQHHGRQGDGSGQLSGDSQCVCFRHGCSNTRQHACTTTLRGLAACTGRGNMGFNKAAIWTACQQQMSVAKDQAGHAWPGQTAHLSRGGVTPTSSSSRQAASHQMECQLPCLTCNARLLCKDCVHNILQSFAVVKTFQGT